MTAKAGVGSINRAALAAVVALASPAAIVGAQARPDSAFDRLPTHRLIKELSALGMVELLRAMEEQIPPDDKSFRAVGTRGLILVGLANALDDAQEHDRLLDQAIALLREAVQKADSGGKSERDALDAFRYGLELAGTLGVDRIENPYMVRIWYLQASQADREAVLQKTKEAVERIDLLKERIRDTLERWRPEPEKLMIYVPELEEMEQLAKYRAAWIRLYRAMALNGEGEKALQEKAQLCRTGRDELKGFTARGAEDTGVNDWASLIMGMLFREERQHDKAAQWLDAVASMESAKSEVRLRAWFERARNRIEEGASDKAEQAIREFQQNAVAVVGEKHRPMVDVRAVLLEDYLCQTRARKEKDPRKARELIAAGQRALLGFVERYADRPGLVQGFLNVLAAKFADVQDLDQAGSVAVLAQAFGKLNAKDVAGAEALFRRALRHKDLADPRIARGVEPTVLWQLALLMNERKANLDAARYFVALARRHPGHELAATAALNAVRSLNTVMGERAARGELIATNLRLAFIQALDALLDRWGQERDNAKWNFDLGTQCMGVAAVADSDLARFYWRTRAIAAFEKVPSPRPEYMESLHSALELRTQVVLASDALADLLKPSDATAQAQLQALAADLLAAERIDLNGQAPSEPGPASRPGAGASRPASRPAPEGMLTSTGPAPDALQKRCDELTRDLAQRRVTYGDPVALVARLKSYSAEAARESQKVQKEADAAGATDDEKAQKKAVAAGLWEWAADAEYQASVIKYDQLARTARRPEDRQRFQTEALAELRELHKKWPGSPILRKAYEFEIRKLIESNQTDQAIARIDDFRQAYPAQADQLIKLMVQNIRDRIAELKKAAGGGEELRRFQEAYVNFARHLYEAVKDLPISAARIDQKLRQIDRLENARDLAGLRKLADEHRAAAAEHRVDLVKVKAVDVLANVVADFDKAAGDDARLKLLPDLAAALHNAFAAVRDAVMDRYARAQMYGDALLEKAHAEATQKRLDDAQKTCQEALRLFQLCRDAHEEGRKLQADEIDQQYAPVLKAIKEVGRADDVRRMTEDLKKELRRQGIDPLRHPEITSLEFAYSYVAKARNQAEEAQRLPRAVNALMQAWEGLRDRLKARIGIDAENVVGQARGHRGLRQYGEAMKLYVQYADGIDQARHPQAYWSAQLERCQCHLEGYRDSPEAMRNLVIIVRQLESIDRTMGGKAAEFRRILMEAERIAAQAQTAQPKRMGAGP